MGETLMDRQVEYTVIFEKGPNNWSAFVPDLPGCISAGTTREETEHNVKEAIEGHLQVMREYGDPIPEPTTDASKVRVAA